MTISQPPSVGSPTYVQNPFIKRPLILDQVASGGFDRQVAYENTPEANALLYLGPKGPSMPVIGKVNKDLNHMMSSFASGPWQEMKASLASLPHQSRVPVMARVGHALQKIMGGHVGDRSFDVFDWVPLIAILVGSGLILAGLFPTGINTFGINQGQLVVGRNGRNDADNDSIMDQALSQLETGVMMLTSIRYEDGCSARLACKLGRLAQDSNMLDQHPAASFVLDSVSGLLPDKYSSFARAFKSVAKAEDDSACQKECYRCIAI